MNSRGSGFFDFSYSTLTLGLLIIDLLFFSVPSKASRVTSIVIAAILLIDAIIILAVSGLRAEEGGVGIASVVWALLMALWSAFADKLVLKGKHEEEVRLTGREEERRTLREWLSVAISTIILVICCIVVVLLTATLILRARDASLAPPGERYYVDDKKYQIHLFCEGNSTKVHGKKVPTVLFEAGYRPFADSMQQVATTALLTGGISRYCYADRPGIGWSDNAPSPFSVGMAADALSEALANAGEEGPFVLASAGVGNLYSRVFSSRHGPSIKGLLLIDPLHEDIFYRRSSSKRSFLFWAWGVISPLGLDRNFGAIFKGVSREDRVFGRASYQNGKFIKAKLQESLVGGSLSKSEISSSRNIQSEKTPLVVISSGIKVRNDDEWQRKQRDLTRLTDNLVSWDVVKEAPSNVWTVPEGQEIIGKRLKELVNKRA